MLDAPIRKRWTLCLSSVALLVMVLVGAPGFGQDAVFTFKDGGGYSKTSGKIDSVDPEGVTIDGQKIPSSEIKKISVAKEPTEISRARDQMDAGRYSDCLEELAKIESVPNNRLIEQEIAFMKAYSTAQISRRGGAIPPDAAGREVQAFINAYPQSHHLYSAIEQYGHLIFAFGKPEVAAPEFAKLKTVGWHEYQLKGHYYYARMMAQTGNATEANVSLDAILADSGTDDLTQQYKLLAQCEKERLRGLAGEADAAVAALQQMIKEQNAENKMLFAQIYNALGDVQAKAGRLKEAMMAYLHTQLLFASEPDSHAEALFHLAEIWPQLEQTDRANQSRETLKSRYRNSFWARSL